MYRLVLPNPRKNIALAFQDVPEARAWLAKQPRAHPQQTLAALALQVEAIDGSASDPALAVELLGLLRTAAVPLQEHIEPRFVRKALPLPADDHRAFELVARFWHRLGVAYLRRYEELGIQGRSLALNRAACALRLAAHSHFLAAYECPPALDRLLLSLLALAIHDDVLARPLPDGDFPHLGDATVAGHLAWAFLLRLIDPYRLTAPQLLVANRALSRWRELAEFRNEPDTDDARARDLDLSALYGAPLPDETPRWLDIRAIDRKLRKRLEALQQGVSPEALKLGRELSPTANIRLLKEIRHSLTMPERETAEEPGDIALAFGGEDAYAVLRGDYLNAAGDIDIDSSVLAHQRTALFGFDRVEQATTAIKRIEVTTEAWKQLDGMVLRPAVDPSPRRQAPCLVAARVRGQARLGVLFGLQVMTGGVLSGGLHWYGGEVEAGWLKRTEPRLRASGRIPAFLICEDEELSLVLPATAGIRVGVTLAIGGATLEHLQPDEVLERGIDFVRYACHAV